jgi:hypothetical protein
MASFSLESAQSLPLDIRADGAEEAQLPPFSQKTFISSGLFPSPLLSCSPFDLVRCKEELPYLKRIQH